MSKKKGAVALSAVILMGTVAGCGSSSTVSQAAPAAPVVHSVVYEVVGTAKSASVTMATGTGTKQATVRLPMTNTQGGSVTFNMSSGSAAYISAQNQGQYQLDQLWGTVTCRISVDGVVVSENTVGKTEEFGVVTCSATV